MSALKRRRRIARLFRVASLTPITVAYVAGALRPLIALYRSAWRGTGRRG